MCFTLLISCSNDSPSNNEPENKIVIQYSRFRGAKQVGFKSVEVVPLIEQISPNETIDLLTIKARIIETNHLINFTVYANKTGSNALYKNQLYFRDGNNGTIGGAPFNADGPIKFNVLKNNGSSFEAVFSGRLVHALNNDTDVIYLSISHGLAKFDY